MPVYEYVCNTCGQSIDRVLPMSAADQAGECPDCGGTLRRRFSRVAVTYGSWGFGATDALVPERPGRGSYRTVRERAERIADGEG